VTLDPADLANDLDRLEAIEKASLRHVAQAIYDFRDQAAEMFANESDLVADIGEDITREALDRMGTAVLPIRLFGKMDYKRARYLFHEGYALRQALLVDSKAEDISGAGTATIQTAQTTMHISFRRRDGTQVAEQGSLPAVIMAHGQSLLTTTIFVKYNYRVIPNAHSELVDITLIALPSGLLQAKYNPDADHTFWRVGRNAPTLGEAFRVRIGITALKDLESWRVQHIHVVPPSFTWDD
jgi:hypothetical protein